MPVAVNREGADEARLDAIAAIGNDAEAVPIAGMGGLDDRTNTVHNGHRRAGGARRSTRLEDGGVPLLDRSDELAFQPRLVRDHLRDGLAFDLRVVEIRILGRGMVAPDGDIGNRGHVQAGLLGKLRFGAVLVQAGHGIEPVARNVRRVVHGNQAIRVAGVAHHQDAHVRRGVLLERLALTDKDLAVDAKQILALHAGLAGHAADEQGPVHAAKAFLDVGRCHDAFEQRKAAVLQLHGQALERRHGRFDFNQVQDQRLMRSEHCARGDAEQEGIADLAGRAGNSNTNGSIHNVYWISGRNMRRPRRGCKRGNTLMRLSGLLVLGRGTKLSEKLMSDDKVYEGSAKFGETTDSYDADGELVASLPVPPMTVEQLNEATAPFIGDIMQTPPMVSAVKINGVPLYKLARKGIEVPRGPRLGPVYNVKFSASQEPLGHFRLACTKGTYVRSIAHELGEKLGCGAHLASLRRVDSGEFARSGE